MKQADRDRFVRYSGELREEVIDMMVSGIGLKLSTYVEQPLNVRKADRELHDRVIKNHFLGKSVAQTATDCRCSEALVYRVCKELQSEGWNVKDIKIEDYKRYIAEQFNKYPIHTDTHNEKAIHHSGINNNHTNRLFYSISA